MWQKRAIVVTRGTMELVEAMPGNEGDEVLAGVLAHELSHIFYRHTFGNEQQAAGEAAVSAGAAAVMINPLVGLAVAGLAWDRSKRYDRMQETEADVLGVKLACAAGFDPSGLLTFMERLKEQNPSHVSFLQTHPSPAQRVQYLQGTIEKLNCPRRATVAAAGTADADDSSKQARAKKAQGDLRILTSAISIYAAHTGQLPSSLTALTNPVRNRQGAVAGPFLAVVPSPPPGWSQYAYAPQPNGVFTVTTTGDDTTLSLP